MTKEQFTILTQYNDILVRCREVDKKNMEPSFFVPVEAKHVMQGIYAQITGHQSCSTCSNLWFKRLAIMYENYKPEEIQYEKVNPRPMRGRPRLNSSKSTMHKV